MMSTIPFPFDSPVPADKEMQGDGFRSARIALSPGEAPCYRYLWSLADPHNTGFISGAPAADFLATSGLPNAILHEIWRLSDRHSEGFLRFEDFCVACRLIAHAQGGIPITPESIYQDPLSIPQFDLTQGQALSMTLSDLNSHGASSLFTSMDAPGSVASASRSAYNSAPYPSGGSAYGDTSLSTPTGYGINENDRLKYTKIFYTLRLDHEGLLPGEEAKTFMSRSGLSDSQLAQTWALVDRDADGRLNVMEFVVAMHLISLSRYGSPIPSSLPGELEQLLIQPGVAASPSTTTPTLLPEAQPTAAEVSPSNKKDSFWDSSLSSPESLPTLDTFSRKDTKHKKLSGRSRKKASRRNKTQCLENEKYEQSVSDALSLDNETLAIPGETLSKRKSKNDQQTKNSLSRVLEGIYKIDQELSKHVARSVDRYADELRELEDVTDAVKAQLVFEKKNLKKQLDRRLDFERQVQALKKELNDLYEEQHQLDYNKILVARDLDHYQNDILFLKQHIETMQKDIDLLRSMQTTAERAVATTEAQTQKLDGARKLAMQNLASEKQLLKEQENDIQTMQQQLDKMREEKEKAQAEYALMQERLRQAEQDRNLLLHAAETERNALMEVQHLRVQAADEKAHLAQCLAGIEQYEWNSSRNGSNVASATRAVATEKMTRLPRDLKGVPSGALSSPLIPVYPAKAASSLGTRQAVTSCSTTSGPAPVSYPLLNDGYYASENGFAKSTRHPFAWTSFGSNNGNGRTLSLNREQRGLERMTRDLVSSSSLPGSTEAVFPNEKTSLGSRRAERLNFYSKDDSSVSDASDEAGQRVKKRQLSGGRKKLASYPAIVSHERSTSSASSKILSGNKSKHKRNTDNALPTTSKYPGIETPSFGPRSLQRITSFSSSAF